jgi:E3 ubiquitin-protein ligase UBR1
LWYLRLDLATTPAYETKPQVDLFCIPAVKESKLDKMTTSQLEDKLCKALRDHPYKFSNRFDDNARRALLEILFRSLTNDQPDYLAGLFPDGFPDSYRLRDSQGNTHASEYTEAARGHPCGHIFKQGEASYHCMTCTDDATCVLCSRCFDSSDHEGHQFHISASAGNNGCCDCGDVEAWKRPVNCAIHTASERTRTEKQPSPLPMELINSIRTTIGRVLDYFCDVISCSPEQLRIPKTEESLKHDESFSRLGPKWYAGGDEYEPEPEYCLIVWNDEKHTIVEVRDVLKRACKATTRFAVTKAWEANDIGRSILRHSRDLKELIRMSTIVESIKVTTTIRTSRDTFREQMCGTIVEWLSDISGCSVGMDHHILRYTICEKMLEQWRVGSEAYNAQIGRSGIDDHAYSETSYRFANLPALLEVAVAPEITEDDENNEEIMAETTGETEAEVMEAEGPFHEQQTRQQVQLLEFEMLARQVDHDDMNERLLVVAPVGLNDSGDMDVDHENEGFEGEPDPSARPDAESQQEGGVFTPTESDSGDMGNLPESQTRNYNNIPPTPFGRRKRLGGAQPSHWMMQPSDPVDRSNIPLHEDLTKNIRLDSMILFDMRMWKKTRIDLRDLYISTVVNVPAFKRILGLRFSGLYTSLSQLYLIADREPDHSIINLSLQMLTSPSITEEVIERGNFLTNLMAILYTFLTSRQVGLPQDVSPSATLAFDTGSVTNRRLYHFFTDLRYFLSSEPVQRKVREERQYLLQFIDLVKLSQGICPNVRAVGEHVEYETDAWIGASLLTREINKLCRQFSESFSVTNSKRKAGDGTAHVIYTAAVATIVNSVGLERQRFNETEIKGLAGFKLLPAFEFEHDTYLYEARPHRVIDYVVETGAISFHHALHYTLSWLIEGGKSMSNLELRTVLFKAGSDFIKQHGPTNNSTTQACYEPEDALLAAYDFPLRVCAWLAQMKAGLWVRNGMSLRHQMTQYKGVSFRDVGYHRDIFLLQTAFATCNPSRLLATMIDRYSLENWMRGMYGADKNREDLQQVDIVEDFIYLLIMILTDRASLITIEEESDPHLVAARKEVIHALCFKPLSFSDLNTKLNERVQDYPDLQRALNEMTTFRAPEGLTDSGTFELKSEYLEELDPYNTNYSKNQRDEAENIYKTWMSKKIGKPVEEIVLEPKLRPILTGAFTGLASFTNSPLFAQIIYYTLEYALVTKKLTPDVPVTRVESLLQVVLQLALIATLEDDTNEDDFTDVSLHSFIHHALTTKAHTQPRGHETIIEVLQLISNMGQYASCRPKIKHMLKLFYRKRPHDFTRATAHLDFPFGRLDTASPANVDQGLEIKKRQALERKAKVMAQFQQQQKNFMDNQGVSNWRDEDLSDVETATPTTSEKKTWRYPTGVCILCQEETNDTRLYGTFGMFTESNILRQTNLDDPDWVREALTTPTSLDHSIDNIRPFGVSGANHKQVVRLTAQGNQIFTDRQGLGKGWPLGFTRRSPISTGCGHLMHYFCFDHYFRSVVRRHAQQIARHHPERIEYNEFVCPLCKALGNAFLPILWKEKEECYPGVLANEETLDSFMDAVAGRILPLQQSMEQSSVESARTTQKSFSVSVTAGFADAMRKAFSFGRSISPTSPVPSSIAELALIFTRLGDTINTTRLNRLQISASTEEQVPYVDVLLSLLASSVSAVEIAQRGTAMELGSTLIDKTSSQSLSHLRILSETINSYISIGEISVESSAEDLSMAQRRLFRQLFARAASELNSNDGRAFTATTEEESPPLLLEDIFDVFVQSCLVLGPTMKINIHHLLHLCYLAQIAQVVLAYMYNPGGLTALVEDPSSQHPTSPLLTPPSGYEVQTLSAFMTWILEVVCTARYMPSKVPPRCEQALFALLRAYSLTFLRKAAIFLYVSHGVDFTASPDDSLSELDRLSHLLRLPSHPELLLGFQPYSGKQSIKDLVSGWIITLAKYQQSKHIEEDNYIPHHVSEDLVDPAEISRLVTNFSRNISLPHPAPLELIGLPKYFDVLMEEANRRRCPTTGKDLTDPALCLFCGEIFCSQAVCCMKHKIGPANLHVEKYVLSILDFFTPPAFFI